MYGFYNKVLKIDLGAQKFKIESVGDDILEKYLGGKGLASYFLSEYNPPGIDPLAAENCLIFATGPVGGSLLDFR